MSNVIPQPAAQPPAAEGPLISPAIEDLNPPQKAAIILGILGAEAAGPILEQMSETDLRRFASAMSRLRRVRPETVRKTIQEFIAELNLIDQTVEGGLGHAREILQDYIPDAALTRIMDEIDMPSANNVWKKLINVDEVALAEFLAREHPQTAAVVISKLSSEHAARILGKLEPEQARDIVLGLTKTSSLDGSVIDAIGTSVSDDFLVHQRSGDKSFKPEERIGSIMNYTTGEIRHSVLGFLDDTQPELADAVKAKMFTFADIPERIERRDVAAFVRQVDNESLLKALAGAVENAPASHEYILASISSRVAEQLREELEEMGKVKVREAEEAQNRVLKTIREMEANNELKLIAIED